VGRRFLKALLDDPTIASKRWVTAVRPAGAGPTRCCCRVGADAGGAAGCGPRTGRGASGLQPAAWPATVELPHRWVGRLDPQRRCDRGGGGRGGLQPQLRSAPEPWAVSRQPQFPSPKHPPLLQPGEWALSGISPRPCTALANAGSKTGGQWSSSLTKITAGPRFGGLPSRSAPPLGGWAWWVFGFTTSPGDGALGLESRPATRSWPAGVPAGKRPRTTRPKQAPPKGTTRLGPAAVFTSSGSMDGSRAAPASRTRSGPWKCRVQAPCPFARKRSSPGPAAPPAQPTLSDAGPGGGPPGRVPCTASGLGAEAWALARLATGRLDSAPVFAPEGAWPGCWVSGGSRPRGLARQWRRLLAPPSLAGRLNPASRRFPPNPFSAQVGPPDGRLQIRGLAARPLPGRAGDRTWPRSMSRLASRPWGPATGLRHKCKQATFPMVKTGPVGFFCPPTPGLFTSPGAGRNVPILARAAPTRNGGSLAAFFAVLRPRPSPRWPPQTYFGIYALQATNGGQESGFWRRRGFQRRQIP